MSKATTTVKDVTGKMLYPNPYHFLLVHFYACNVFNHVKYFFAQPRNCLTEEISKPSSQNSLDAFDLLDIFI